MSTVLITGANRGIGLATSLAFGRAGYTVYATMRDPNRSSDLDEAAVAEGLAVQVGQMDVDSSESVAETISSILEESGGLDVLVNNAGIERRGSTEEVDLDVVRACMETNYFGAIRCMQAVIPHMRERGRGSIVNVTSVAGKIAFSPLGPYAASKHALEAFSETTAQELKPCGIRLAIIEPGIIDTDMAQDIAVASEESTYPNLRRTANMFTAALETPTAPALVADKILEVVESGTWKLRHPVGPDAEPFLAWRAGMTGEEWVDWSAANDDTWYAQVQRDFGLDARRPQ